VIKRAEEENVMVYAIGLAGSSRGRGSGGGGRGFGAGGYGGRSAQSDRPDDGLPKIAAATGGGYFELTSTDDLGSTFTRVADELHRQYALGFTPSKLDGKLHTLELRVAQPGLTARARKSYLATTPRS
jgi:VWFA-related protein